MTEAEWLASADPMAMLEHLRDDDEGCRRVGVYSSRVFYGRKVVLWSAAVLGWEPRQIMSVRGFFPGERPDEFRIRLADSGSNGDNENYTVDAEKVGAAALLRCVVGSPFRQVQLTDFLPQHWPKDWKPKWLRQPDGTVQKLVQGIDADRAFDRLPILADALEDAGCDSAGILAHCRGPGPHVRGCWVVDLLLGKG